VVFHRDMPNSDPRGADPRVREALAGKTSIGMITSGSRAMAEYTVEPGDAMAVWLPVRDNNGDVLGALAVDWHLDALAEQIAHSQRMLAVGVLIGFSALFALLMFAAGRARNMLKEQELERLLAQQELESQRDAFEQKVEERTEDLRLANHELELEIAERRRSEELIREVAFYDALTKLPNRTLFKSDLERSLAEAKRRSSRLAVMFIDLDNFKRINDTLGHNMGDELLRQAAVRLSGCIRGEDSLANLVRKGAANGDGGNRVARLGGDEFTVLLHDVGSSFNAAHVAQRIIEAFAAPFVLDIYKVRVSPSIGIAYYPLDGGSADELLRHADTAMYNAKQRGRNTFSFYTRAMSESAYTKLALENRLRGAIEREEFVLHYQPKYDARDNSLVGFEALLRWNDPQHGLVAPGDFISLAEETGLIVPISEWVIQETCRQLRHWQDRGGQVVPVSLNLSSLHFQHPRLAPVIQQALDQAQVSPTLLEIEVTESLFLDDMDTAVATLTRLRESGVRIAIDDFGTGYSSLSYLKRFPLDTLKIDRSFVQDLAMGGDDAAICNAIVALGRILGLKVVAEGVENAEQARLLLAQGCDEMQGFLFGSAMPAEQATRLLLPSGVVPFKPVRKQA
jgi:diguanylate cyclase (GGDEF)-like protein